MRKFSFRHCGGFTLLEVLIVVVIAATVAAFAVPAYKKAQDKNRFMAASGFLINAANAVRMFKADYPNITATMPVTFRNATDSGALKACDNGTIEPNSSNLLTFLTCEKRYLADFPFLEDQYQGYQFVISTDGSALCGNSCKPSGAMACMSGENRIPEYTCAWVDNSGLLHNTSI